MRIIYSIGTFVGSALRVSSTPAFAAGLECSGKPVRQHALVMFRRSIMAQYQTTFHDCPTLIQHPQLAYDQLT
jgi:hypothetical protein